MKTKLFALEIPDDPGQVPTWLEGHLLGLDLPQIVAELSVLNSTTREPVGSLADLLGEKTQAVLQLGLRSLTTSQIRQLLRQPQLLFELQEFVLNEGGPYWTTVPQCDEIGDNTRKAWAYLQAERAADVQPRAPSRRAWMLAGAGWLAATAATIAMLFVRADRVRELENQVVQQSGEIRSLRDDLLAQQRIVPADLPDANEALVNATADPNDLPGGDPLDLPDIQ